MSLSPKHYNSPRYEGTRTSKFPKKTYDYEDDEKEMGASSLLIEFAAPPYLKDSNYPMISRNMMGLGTIMALGLPTSSKNTRGIKRDSNAKLAATPHRRDTVMVRQARERNNWKLDELKKQFTSNFHSTYK
jgi:hypothetical protein